MVNKRPVITKKCLRGRRTNTSNDGKSGKPSRRHSSSSFWSQKKHHRSRYALYAL